MTGEIRIGRRPTPPRRTATSNDELIQEWLHHLKGQAKNTRRGKAVAVTSLRVALPAGMLLTEVQAHHLRDYMSQYHDRCRYLMAGAAQGARCKAGYDLSGCGTSCPGWRAKTREVFATHMRGVSDFFSFLSFAGYIDNNWVPDLVRQWRRGVRWTSEDEEVGFRPTIDDVAALVNGTPVQRSTVYATMSKAGLRIHEAMLLQVDSVDLDAKWLTIPRGGKRKGNNMIPIDRELQGLLSDYLDYRGARARPGTTSFFVNGNGGPLAPTIAAQAALNRRWWQPDAVRLGLQAPGRLRPRERWRSQNMRHVYSDALSEAGCPDPWYGVLRGDRVRAGSNRGRYTNTGDLERIRHYYDAYAPVYGFD